VVIQINQDLYSNHSNRYPLIDRFSKRFMLDAVEIVSEQTRVQYIESGLKNSGVTKSIIRASDAHLLTDQLFPTWVYLPEISTPGLRHAFCIPEASIRFDEIETAPLHTIDSISFDSGMHNGKTFEFVERTTALVGAPSTGKSLVIDALRFAFGLESPID
jgi:hypothetical protein